MGTTGLKMTTTTTRDEAGDVDEREKGMRLEGVERSENWRATINKGQPSNGLRARECNTNLNASLDYWLLFQTVDTC